MSTFEMNPALASDVKREIEFNYGGKEKGTYINQIECPTCSKKEAFTSSVNPWVIKCGRANNCGENHHIKGLFPHLFESWTERYQPATEQERHNNPTAVADAYLKYGRGFDLVKVGGWYTQEWYQNHDINEGSTTVRFKMPNGFWERVLDKPERFGKLKARAVGDYKGLAWIAPIFSVAELAEAKEIVITEGIFDAISWIHSGHIAISNISSSNFPATVLDEIEAYCKEHNIDRPKLIWAQDGDKAGRTAIKKFTALAKKRGWICHAAQPPSGRKDHDWNDLHQLEKMSDRDINNYLYYGDLLLAETASEKATLMYSQTARRNFWFTFGSWLYWFKLDWDRFEKEVQTQEKAFEELDAKQREMVLKTSGVVEKIATAIPRPLYFQENTVTNEQWYYFSIETDEGTVKLPFTPKQLTSASEFKNRMLAAKNAWWVGQSFQLERILMDMTHNLKTVETIDFIGYSKAHSTYIWNECAVKDGRIKAINKEDYYEFGRLSIKTLASTPELEINTDARSYDRNWPGHVYGAFQNTGLITTAWWLGSLFAEQIRGFQKSYPFFELIGDAGAGKSTLLEFLWKLTGRGSYEGFDPQKYTVAARAREFAQVSNLPVSLIESDREASDGAKAKQMDWDELKDAYNGRAMRGRGVKNGGNDTYAPPFRGAIFISQNEAVNASEAILSRICHIRVTREFQTAETYRHAQWLETCPLESVSHFMLDATTKEKAILEIVQQKTQGYQDALMANDEIRMRRIALIHGQIMALVDCLGPECLGLFQQTQIDSAKAQLETMAVDRQRAINADHPLVQEFWESVDFIDNASDTPKLNHYGFDDYNWAINLKEYERWCGEFKLRGGDIRELKRHLKTSQSRKFVESNKAVRSKIKEGKTVKCWIFSKPKSNTSKAA